MRVGCATVWQLTAMLLLPSFLIAAELVLHSQHFHCLLCLGFPQQLPDSNRLGYEPYAAGQASLGSLRSCLYIIPALVLVRSC